MRFRGWALLMLALQSIRAWNVAKQRLRTLSTRLCSTSENETIQTLAPGRHSSELIVKKSRFIAYAQQVTSWEQATQCLQDIKAEHPKARHWCYAYRGGWNPVNERSSDDGEPSGTAGAPILAALRGSELSDVFCVVVRYFGGIKLGAGGLIRSYGAAARQVLEEAPFEVTVPTASVRVQVDGSYVGVVYEMVGRVQGESSEEEYGADGSLSVTIVCEASSIGTLKEGLRDATRGSASFLE